MKDYDISEPDQVMSSAYNDMVSLHVATNHVLLVTNVNQMPVELQDGVSKIIKYAPHKNLVDESSLLDDSFTSNPEYRWYIQYVFFLTCCFFFKVLKTEQQ